jgi:hypothetical protein
MDYDSVVTKDFFAQGLHFMTEDALESRNLKLKQDFAKLARSGYP